MTNFTALQSDTIFNWYSLAIQKDDSTRYQDYSEVDIVVDTLSELFGVSKDDIKQEYQNRL